MFSSLSKIRHYDAMLDLNVDNMSSLIMKNVSKGLNVITWISVYFTLR